jgi:hypothetical protein
MAQERKQRMLRSSGGAEVARKMREEEAAQGAQQWPELFKDLLRRNADEDLVERVEAHWLPDIRNGQETHAIPEDALFFLKVWAFEMLTEEKVREAMASGGELRDLSERMRAIEEEHGVERGEPWLPGQGPEPWEELRRQWQERVDALFAETLEAHGEEELSRMFREDPEGFEEREERGRRLVFQG